MPKIDYQMTGRWLIAGWLAAIALFRGAPSVDLDISRLFWRAGAGFTLVGNPLWEFLRQRIWDAALLLLLFAVIALIRALISGRAVLGIPARVWGFVVALYVLAPGIVVNLWLKSSSGRARPASVQEFGGSKLFTPAGQFTDQCTKNCSFVSGEVSAAVALGLVLWLAAALWTKLEGWQRGYLRVAGLFIPGFVIVQRVVTGRHFPSDAVFAGLITLSIAWALHAVFSGRLPGPLARLARVPGRRG